MNNQKYHLTTIGDKNVQIIISMEIYQIRSLVLGKWKCLKIDQN